MNPALNLKPVQADRTVRSTRAALRWRLLLLWMAGLLIPTALMTLPVFQLLSAHLDWSAHVPQLAHSLDLVAIGDLQLIAARESTHLTNAAYLSVFLTLLISPLLTGMAISAARTVHVAGFRELLAGGLREYPRMLRMLVLAIVLLGVVGVLVGAMLNPARAALPRAMSIAVAGFGLLLLGVTHASLDAGRAMMALDRRRTSEVGSWWLGCRLLLRHPVSGLGAYFLITLAGLALAALLSWLRLQVAGTETAGLILAFVLTQATVAAIAWMRIARLFAMIAVAR